jgi:hypothetical protein
MGFPFPLIFLLIFVFTHTLAGFIVSIGIIVLLWALIAASSSSGGRRWMSPPMNMNQPPIYQPPPYQPPIYQPPYQPYTMPPEPTYTPYEQGYQAEQTKTESAEPEPSATASSEAQYEEQPTVQYPQELPPMQQ